MSLTEMNSLIIQDQFCDSDNLNGDFEWEEIL